MSVCGNKLKCSWCPAGSVVGCKPAGSGAALLGWTACIFLLQLFPPAQMSFYESVPKWCLVFAHCVRQHWGMPPKAWCIRYVWLTVLFRESLCTGESLDVRVQSRQCCEALHTFVVFFASVRRSKIRWPKLDRDGTPHWASKAHNCHATESCYVHCLREGPMLKTRCLLIAAHVGAMSRNSRCLLVIVVKDNKTVETYCLLHSCSALITEVLLFMLFERGSSLSWTMCGICLQCKNMQMQICASWWHLGTHCYARCSPALWLLHRLFPQHLCDPRMRSSSRTCAVLTCRSLFLCVCTAELLLVVHATQTQIKLMAS